MLHLNLIMHFNHSLLCQHGNKLKLKLTKGTALASSPLIQFQITIFSLEPNGKIERKNTIYYINNNNSEIRVSYRECSCYCASKLSELFSPHSSHHRTVPQLIHRASGFSTPAVPRMPASYPSVPA